ncbi:aspartyl-phosphate phosphatase Spo0E family protein [Desulfosporosinus meridiei]|uniref:Spo0E like sporulation regulatory protein n=1 Tax=Desulfosporosinus meridiei (strain ATCC BAA-275 / DSM 13257 / KCTC 12902 / NCIMB 13706 / S10) TaxID=768704 RepID=J7IKT0_DESMD|nr:aspartyl-phosphate phosphatase Spo0E family protein [Desulfosporosinus meridiei]AFQ42367.1 Spo0E like sporulation regulatory protein [Desulfosporosinus meridiei DSM 13257]
MKPKVLEQIEALRLEMQQIALDKDLTDPRVVMVSQRLDLLINKFYLFQRKKWQRCYKRRA